MNNFSTKQVFASLLLLAGFSLSTVAKADTITWTDWSGAATGNSGTGPSQTSVNGTLALGSGITVTYSGQLNAVTNEPSWPLQDATYNGGSSGNSPAKNLYSIIEDGGVAYTESFTFSSPVTDPYLAIWSLGNSGQTVSLNFTNAEPWTIASCGTGSNYGGACITKSGNDVVGSEGNGTIHFTGTYSSLTFDMPNGEFYFALQVGAVALAPPTPPPAVPEPSGLFLLGTGILSVVGAGRRKLFKV